jgi:hypothetical protein
LKTENGQQTVAKGIFRAIRQYKKELEKAAPVKMSNDKMLPGRDSGDVRH